MIPAGFIEEKDYVNELTHGEVTQYVSFRPQTKEEKRILFKAMNNPDHYLKDCINMKLKIRNVYCETVQLEQEDGSIQIAPRIVLIDEKGEGYQAVSLGVYGALKKLFQIIGTPEQWEEAVEIKVKQISKSAEKNILTFELC